jgi:hypothetical protein
LNEGNEKRIRQIIFHTYSFILAEIPISKWSFLINVSRSEHSEVVDNNHLSFGILRDVIKTIDIYWNEKINERMRNSKLLTVMYDGMTDKTGAKILGVAVVYVDRNDLQKKFNYLESCAVDSRGVQFRFYLFYFR